MGLGARRRRSTSVRGASTSRAAGDAGSGRSASGLTSVVATILVCALLPVDAPRGERARRLQEWFSFWRADPSIAPDEVHGRAFEAWLRAGYPLLAVTAVLLWLVDEQWPDHASPAPWFAMLFFGLCSGALHLRLSLQVTRRATTSARVVAGWPTELALLVPCTAIAVAIFS